MWTGAAKRRSSPHKPDLGERLGSGWSAEVFAYGEGKVILREDGSLSGLEREAAAQRAADVTKLPVLEVFGIEQIDGRAGLVMALRRWRPP